MRRKRIRLIFILLTLFLGIYLFSQLTEMMWPFILGLVLAYLLNPLVCWLEAKKIGRKYAIALVFIAIIVFLLSFFRFIARVIPGIEQTIGYASQDDGQFIQIYGEHQAEFFAGRPSWGGH